VKKRSNPATEFSAYLAKVLNKKRLRKIHKWKKNWHGNKGETADVAGLNLKGKARVLIEVERLREDPSSNVVKIWHWLEQGSVPDDVTILHVFSKAYTDRKKPRKERAKFVAQHLRKEFKKTTYLPLDIAWNPKSGAKGIGGAAKGHADRLARRIGGLIG
jgi:hypothetical protein